MSSTQDWDIPDIKFDGLGGSTGSRRERALVRRFPIAPRVKATHHRLKTAAKVASRFPVTLTLLVQYVAFVLIPVTYDGNPFPGFVIGLTLGALAVAFGVEVLLYSFRPDWGQYRRISVHRAGVIALFGCLLSLIDVHLGKSYGYGVTAGLKQASPLTTLISPFHYWPAAGVLLAIYSYRHQPETRRWVWFYTLTTIAALLVVALLSSEIGGVMYSPLLVIGVGAVLTGMLRMRVIVVCVIGAILVWPVLAHVRNEGRIAKGATSYAYAAPGAAAHRIEFDQFMANAYLAKQAGVQIVGLPPWSQVAVDAVIPRFLDPGRPVLQTATLINEATGGNGKSSETFTTFGETWFLYGWRGLILIQALITLAAALLVRNRGPTAFVVLGAVVVELLGAEGTLPDALAGCIQAAIAAIIAILVVRPVRGTITG